jgi:hypothetical protein
MDLTENKVGRCGLDASDSGQEPLAGSCEHGKRWGIYLTAEQLSASQGLCFMESVWRPGVTRAILDEVKRKAYEIKAHILL